MTKLWEGYSFMFVDADSKNKWSQNLGDAGSCMRNFYTAQYSECSAQTPQKCFGGTGNHRTAYLTVAAEPDERDFKSNLPYGKLKLSRKKELLMSYISRCVVCETVFKLVVVHSMNSTIPQCPSGYEKVPNPSRNLPSVVNSKFTSKLWEGYSFWQFSQDYFGLGVNSEQPASCLMYFSPTAIARCDVEGCNIEMNDATRNFWYMNVKKGEAGDDYEEFFDSSNYISRCTVCRRPEAKYFKIVQN